MRADSRAVGVAGGVSGKDKLLLEHIYREASLREGDIIVTSGYSGSHPADILIGKVTATHMDSVGLLQEADIVPAADIADVEQVLVIVGFTPEAKIVLQGGQGKMRRLIWPVLFLFLMLLQGSMSVYYTGWLSCDLLLLAVYAYGKLLRGEKAGVVGGITGLLQDAMTVGIFGFHILSRICVGYIVGLTKEKVFKDNYLYHMSAIATITFILRFVYWWLELLRSGGRWSIFFAYLWDSLAIL